MFFRRTISKSGAGRAKGFRTQGFTIVELLIVVVVIAILAAITTVAYNGISREAEASALKSALRNTTTKLTLHKTSNNDIYPESLDASLSAEGDNIDLTYTRNSNASFCLSAASNRVKGLVLHTTEAGKIEANYCTGHEPVAYTNAACFAFNSGVITYYYNNENDDPANPSCPREVEVPSSIGGAAVTSVGDVAFLNTQLTSVTLPNSVTNIGASAFQGNQLSSVVIPNSVISIEGAAFRSNHLTSVTLPNSVTSIGSFAFSGNQMSSVTIPTSVTNIGASAFQGNQLSSVTIPNSVTSIGNSAFSGNQLTSVTLPNSVTSIESFAFSGNQLSSVTIPSSVSHIGAFAFQDNQLTSATIPSSVASIEDFAFYENQLTSVSIPAATTIQSTSFDSGVTINRY